MCYFRSIESSVAFARRKELNPKQGKLDLEVDKQVEVDGVGMGVLKDGTAFLTGRGLARLVGIENLHIRTIGLEWNEDPLKPRVAAIKAILAKRQIELPSAHIETSDGARPIHAYPDVVCPAVLEYYAFDAANPRGVARDNYRLLAGKALQELIYSRVGYDPSGGDRFKKWHDRIALNYQSAPRGFFHVLNEAHTIIYELIMAGAKIDDKFVVDGSIGSYWSRFWDDNELSAAYGGRCKYPHRYPMDHPQAKSNPQESWCYPLAALGDFREWLQGVYIEGGKFRSYLNYKVNKGDLPLSFAQLAISALVPDKITGPRPN
ncbi:hypothetical protein [Mesorhizobium sp. M1342]|uniref:hypothetical protein n=1 Tax=Mesorhizobium sp. M1342 TaxID=2957088 RepID=UPI0033378E65